MHKYNLFFMDRETELLYIPQNSPFIEIIAGYFPATEQGEPDFSLANITLFKVKQVKGSVPPVYDLADAPNVLADKDKFAQHWEYHGFYRRNILSF